MTAVTPGREELAEIIHKARFVGSRTATPFADEDHNGRMYCFRIADAVRARLAAKPADEGRTEAAYAAYLGIMVLATMCKKAGLSLAQKRATELLIEMGQAFPEFAGRSALRSTTRKPKP